MESMELSRGVNLLKMMVNQPYLLIIIHLQQAYLKKKYLSRFNLRMKLPRGSKLDLYMEYDSSGLWKHCGHIEGRGTRTFLLPVRPARCDHLRFRIEGKGEIKLYSLAVIREEGSDA